MLTRPELLTPLRPQYALLIALGVGAAGLTIGAGVWAYAKHHVHETMPRVVDCRADATTLECQVAIDAAMFRVQHPAPPADGHFVVTVVDCNGITWSIAGRNQQATISVDETRHCVDVRAYSMSVPGATTWDTPPGDVRLNR